MRNASHYREMIRVYTTAEQMQKMCQFMKDCTTSEEGALRDIIEGINTRLYQIMSISNQASRDEFDFGPQGIMFTYTLKHIVLDALKEMGVKVVNEEKIAE